MEYSNLSLDEIQRQLAEIEQNKAELSRVLNERREEAKFEVAQQIKDLIAQYGYTQEEIIPLIEGKRRRGSGRRGLGGSRQYTRYVDPQDSSNVYVRGVLPGWMKQKMLEQGYDPSIKQDREAFKSNYLQAVEAA